jgi:hypothetical protein
VDMASEPLSWAENVRWFDVYACHVFPPSIRAEIPPVCKQ